MNVKVVQGKAWVQLFAEILKPGYKVAHNTCLSSSQLVTAYFESSF
jgi:hypothetical protein